MESIPLFEAHEVELPRSVFVYRDPEADGPGWGLWVINHPDDFRTVSLACFSFPRYARAYLALLQRALFQGEEMPIERAREIALSMDVVNAIAVLDNVLEPQIVYLR